MDEQPIFSPFQSVSILDGTITIYALGVTYISGQRSLMCVVDVAETAPINLCYIYRKLPPGYVGMVTDEHQPSRFIVNFRAGDGLKDVARRLEESLTPFTFNK